MSLVDALILFLMMVSLAIIPSTSVALVVTRSATAGFANGAAVTAGIVLGDLLFVLLVVLGMAALAELMGGLFLILRYLAGAYLIWLGISLLRSRPVLPSTVSGGISGGLPVSFLSGFFLTLGDIKAIFFYASLFPVFVDLTRIGIADIALLLVLTTLSVGGIKLAYAYAACRLSLQGRRFGLGKGARLTAGGLMLGAGSYLIAKA